MKPGARLLYAISGAGAAALIIAAALPADSGGERLYRESDTGISYTAEVGENGVTLVVGVATTAAAAAAPTGTANIVVDINTASVWELAGVLPGIGESKAQSIVEYREAVGGFRSVEELIEVEGIGEALLEQIRPYCTVGEQP